MTSHTEEREDRRRPLAFFWTVGLAALLAVSTGVGIVKSVNSSTTDRVVPSSTAPAYGTR